MLTKILSVILGILMIGVGIYCAAMPEESYFLIPVLLGAAVVAAGVGFIVVYVRHKKNGRSESLMLVCGILTVLMGLITLFNEPMQLGLAFIWPQFIAIWLTVTGIFRIVDSFAIKDMSNIANDIDGRDVGSAVLRAAVRDTSKQWWVHLVFGILLLVVGMLATFNPITTALALGLLLGIAIIISGIDLIVFALMGN